MALGRKTGGRTKDGNKKDDLQAFARRVEAAVIKANLKDSETIERLICRILIKSEKNPAVAAMMAQKWVEWRYGKAIQPISGKDGGPIALQLITNVELDEQ